jgi:hypothetical protein|nr:MAG TPA: hypothetical protein [Caudoviricetes sp.]
MENQNEMKETLEKLGTVIAMGINLYKKIIMGLMVIIVTLILTVGGVVCGFVYYLSQYDVVTTNVGSMSDDNNVVRGDQNNMNAETINNGK